MIFAHTSRYRSLFAARVARLRDVEDDEVNPPALLDERGTNMPSPLGGDRESRVRTAARARSHRRSRR
jgi:hypothetical protein